MSRKISLSTLFGLIFTNAILTPFIATLVITRVEGVIAEQVDIVTTQLIIGVNQPISNNYVRLRDLLNENGGEIIGKVSGNDGVVAIVVELPLKIALSLSSGMKTYGLASYVEPRMQAKLSFLPDDKNWSDQWAPKKIEAD